MSPRECITVPLERIKKLVAEKTKPRDRSEQEIADDRDVLTTILHLSRNLTRDRPLPFENPGEGIKGESSAIAQILLGKVLSPTLF